MAFTIMNSSIPGSFTSGTVSLSPFALGDGSHIVTFNSTISQIANGEGFTLLTVSAQDLQVPLLAPPPVKSIWHSPNDGADVELHITEPNNASGSTEESKETVNTTTVLYVHKTVLSFASPVWKAALSGPIEDESSSGDGDDAYKKRHRYILPINHSNADTVLSLLNCIYPIDVERPSKLAELKALFDLAFQYEVATVIRLTLEGSGALAETDMIDFAFHVDAKTNGSPKVPLLEAAITRIYKHLLHCRDKAQRNAMLGSASKPLLLQLAVQAFQEMDRQKMVSVGLKIA